MISKKETTHQPLLITLIAIATYLIVSMVFCYEADICKPSIRELGLPTMNNKPARIPRLGDRLSLTLELLLLHLKSLVVVDYFSNSRF